MELANNLIKIFNNREWSIIVWSSAFFFWAVSRKEVRASLYDVFRAFFQFKIVIPIILLTTYVTGILLLLFKLGFWGNFLLKDTIIWYFGVAFIMLINSVKASEEDGYFKKVIIETFKFVVIIQFVLNTYVFSFPVELVIIPISTTLVMMSVISESKEEYQPAHKVIQFFLILIGSSFLLFSFSKMFGDTNNFLSIVNLKKILLTPILTLTLLPFIYFMAIYILYETIFVVLSIKTYWKDNLRHIKFKLITTCKFSRRRLSRFRKTMHKFDLATKEGVALAMQEIKS